MNRVKVSYKSLIPNALWAWILIWVPTLIKFLKLKGSKYEYDDDYLVVQEGIVHKYQNYVSLEKLIDVTASQSVLGYGDIVAREKDKYVRLNNIEDPIDMADRIRILSKEAKHRNKINRESLK